MRVPKKWDGVRSFHLKFCDSVALPIYQTMLDVRLKIEGLKEVEERGDLAKNSDDEGDVKDISGSKDGKSVMKKKKKTTKGRIHEVRYMGVGEGMDSDDDVDENELVRSEENDEFMWKKEEDLTDESNDNEGNADETAKTEEMGEDLSIDGIVGKKRKKDKSLKKEALGVLNVGKQAMKKAKTEKKVGKKAKKEGLSSREEAVEIKRKKKSERVVKVKDVKPKKRLSAM